MLDESNAPVDPGPETTLTMPDGNPASWASCASKIPCED